MFDESEDKPRRNLMAISLLFIVYALAGGDVTDKGNFGIAYMHISKPEVIEYIAVILFLYFYWSYWLTHKGRLKTFLPSITTTMKNIDDAIELFNVAVLSSQPGQLRKDALQSHIEIFKANRSNIPLPSRTGLFEWKYAYTSTLSMNINGTVQNVDFKVYETANPDLYLLIWLKAFFIIVLTTDKFREVLLPYSMAWLSLILVIIC